MITLIPVFTNKVNTDILSIIDKIYTQTQIVIGFMGTEPNTYKHLIPDDIRTVFIDDPDNFSYETCMKYIFMATSNILKNDEPAIITDVSYGFSFLQNCRQIRKKDIQDYSIKCPIIKDGLNKSFSVTNPKLMRNVVLTAKKNVEKKKGIKVGDLYISSYRNLLNSFNNLLKSKAETNYKNHMKELISLYPVKSTLDVPALLLEDKSGNVKIKEDTTYEKEKREIRAIDKYITPKKVVEDIISKNKINITIVFNNNKLPGIRSGRENIWVELIKLLCRSNRYNIIIGGSYPFSRDTLKCLDDIYFLEDRAKNNEDLFELAKIACVNSEISIGLKNETFLKLIPFSKKSLIWGPRIEEFCALLDNVNNLSMIEDISYTLDVSDLMSLIKKVLGKR